MPSVDVPKVGGLDNVGLLFSLLPGIVAYLVVHYLTARARKLDAVEAVLHGLAYTLVVNAIWTFLCQWSWFPTPDLVGLSICAVAFGVGIAKVHNAGWGYNFLRSLGLTHQPPWSSVWQTAFERARPDYSGHVLLYFKDARRMQGNLRGWSEDRDKGYLAVDNCLWLDEKNQETSLGEDLLLLDTEQVSIVQFLVPVNKEGANGKR